MSGGKNHLQFCRTTEQHPDLQYLLDPMSAFWTKSTLKSRSRIDKSYRRSRTTLCSTGMHTLSKEAKMSSKGNVPIFHEQARDRGLDYSNLRRGKNPLKQNVKQQKMEKPKG